MIPSLRSLKKDRNVTLKIVLEGCEREVAKGGKKLCGKVEIEIRNEQISGDKVMLSLQGEEKTVSMHGLSKGHHVFFSETVMACDLSNQILKPGKRTHPFSINLPESLPSSFSYKLGLGDDGYEIQYTLAAGFARCADIMQLPIESAPLRANKSPHIVKPAYHPLKGFNRQGRGSVAIAARVYDTNVRKGDSIVVALSCRNYTTVDIQRLEVKIVELVNWGAREGYSKSRLLKETLVKKSNIEFPGLQKRKKATDGRQNKTNEVKSMGFVSDWNEIELSCPSRAKDTYAGRLIDVNHYLKIKFITKQPGSPLSIKVPLTIGCDAEIPHTIFCVPLDLSETEKEVLAPPVEKNVQVWNEAQDLPFASASQQSFTTEATFDESHSEGYDGTFPPMEEMLVEGVVGKSSNGGLEVSLRNMMPLLPPV